jgi:hypothetical protein
VDKRPISQSGYFSPVLWAHGVVDGVRKARLTNSSKLSEAPSVATIATAKRILTLPAVSQKDLLDAKAPKHVFRWVAWAPREGRAAAQRQRADLVLHLHNTFNRTKLGWFLEYEAKAALDVWMRECAMARTEGRAQPRAHEISPDLYEAAIRSAKTRPRPRKAGAAACESAPQLAPSATVNERTLVDLLRKALDALAYGGQDLVTAGGP